MKPDNDHSAAEMQTAWSGTGRLATNRVVLITTNASAHDNSRQAGVMHQGDRS